MPSPLWRGLCLCVCGYLVVPSRCRLTHVSFFIELNGCFSASGGKRIEGLTRKSNQTTCDLIVNAIGNFVGSLCSLYSIRATLVAIFLGKFKWFFGNKDAAKR